MRVKRVSNSPGDARNPGNVLKSHCLRNSPAYQNLWTFILEIPWNFYFSWNLTVTYFRHNKLYLFQKYFLCKCSIFVLL